MKTISLLMLMLITVASNYTPVNAAALMTNSNITFKADVTVDEDEKIPIEVKGLSRFGNQAVLNNLTYTLSDPLVGAWVARVATDPPNILGYFIPTGTLGAVTMTVSGENKKGNTINGTVDIDVVVGAALTVEITPLAPVPNF